MQPPDVPGKSSSASVLRLVKRKGSYSIRLYFSPKIQSSFGFFWLTPFLQRRQVHLCSLPPCLTFLCRCMSTARATETVQSGKSQKVLGPFGRFETLPRNMDLESALLPFIRLVADENSSILFDGNDCPVRRQSRRQRD